MSANWYDAGQAGKYLGISRQAVEQHQRKGNIDAVRFGNVGERGKWLYTLGAIIDFAYSDKFTNLHEFERRHGKIRGDSNG